MIKLSQEDKGQRGGQGEYMQPEKYEPGISSYEKRRLKADVFRVEEHEELREDRYCKVI